MQTPKKLSMSITPRSPAIKRENEDVRQHSKRTKSDEDNFFEKSNFIRTCEEVVKNFKEDIFNRIQPLYLPDCINNCTHINSKNLEKINEIPPHAEETFNIEMRSNKWYEALEVGFLSITPTKYLSESVLKNIVEVMLNAHEDPLSEYHMTHLIDKCQQTLSLNIKMHPPCSSELVKCYKKFLTSPMDLRKKTLTNRIEYGSESGIFKYCINRLENELRTDSKDGPFFNKEEKIPNNVQQKIQEMHWVKSRLEIYEMLNRTDRIDRLMAVMDSMTELLRFDMAMWQSRQVINNERGISRHQKPLIVEIFSQDTKKIYKNDINETCVQIMKIFVYFVYLDYPEKYIRTMSLWINMLGETLHINGKPDYDDITYFYKLPQTEYTKFDRKFYEIIADLPPNSILKILERIRPDFVKYSIAIQHCRKLLNTNEGNIIKILINFMNKCQWEEFPEMRIDIKAEETKITKSITPDNILKRLTLICKNHNKLINNKNSVVYSKFATPDFECVIDRYYVMRTLYITFQAYLNNYNILRFEKTLSQLNNESNENKLQESQGQPVNKKSCKSLSKLISMYTNIYINLQEYVSILQSLKSKKKLPEIFNIFEFEL